MSQDTVVMTHVNCTHSSTPGTNTVDEFGLDRTEPTALSRVAFRSFNSFVCCANLRSISHVQGNKEVYEGERREKVKKKKFE